MSQRARPDKGINLSRPRGWTPSKDPPPKKPRPAPALRPPERPSSKLHLRWEDNHLAIESIIDLVARFCGCTPDELVLNDKAPSLNRPRYLAMYLCRSYTRRSLNYIGERLGKRNHATIYRGAFMTAWRIGERPAGKLLFKCKPSDPVDQGLRADVEKLKQLLDELLAQKSAP